MTVATPRCSSFRLPAIAERMRVAAHAADMGSCGGRRSALIGDILPALAGSFLVRSQACSCRRRKRREGNSGTARDGAAGADGAKANAKTRIAHIKTYVRHVTAVRIEGPKPACQGLHNGTFLPYGSSHMGDWPAACHRSPRNGFQLVAALPGG